MKPRREAAPMPTEHWGVALNSGSSKSHLWHGLGIRHLARCGWSQRPYEIGAPGPKSVRCLRCAASAEKKP